MSIWNLLRSGLGDVQERVSEVLIHAQVYVSDCVIWYDKSDQGLEAYRCPVCGVHISAEDTNMILMSWARDWNVK